MKCVGDRIKERRIGLQMSQSTLSRKCKFSIRAVQEWEKGKSLPGCEAICVLCKTLGCSADWLLGLGVYQDDDASSKFV